MGMGGRSRKGVRGHEGEGRGGEEVVGEARVGGWGGVKFGVRDDKGGGQEGKMEVEEEVEGELNKNGEGRKIEREKA